MRHDLWDIIVETNLNFALISQHFDYEYFLIYKIFYLDLLDITGAFSNFVGVDLIISKTLLNRFASL